MALVAAKVKSLKEPGRYGDGNGLYLNISPSGSKSWVQRITVDGTRTDKGLGSVKDISLSKARDLALANRVVVAGGGNPWATGKLRVQSEESKGVPTFRDLTYTVQDVYANRWRSDKARKTWIQQMELHVLPVIGDIPITEVSRQDVICILKGLRVSKVETSRKMRQAMSKVCRYAMAEGHIDVNPAGEVISAALPPIPKIQGHFTALHYSQVPDAINTIRDSEAMTVTRLCFEFLILTASRSAEARGARWEEIDLDHRVWSIPADRSKDGKEHRKPLSRAAVDVLREAKRKLADSTGLVFPKLGKAPSENCLSKFARVNNIGAHPHGFRSSFRDWAAEQGIYDRVAIEYCLSHNPLGAVEAAYFRSDLIDQRRPIMEAWGDMVAPDLSPF